jgi:O-antigen/teichoic acid export membrane protein
MSLRSKVMRGSAYLLFREGLGMLISIGNVLLVTRAIGPSQYGIYATAYGLSQVLHTFGHLGIGIYLIRQEGEQTRKDYNQAFSLLLVLGSLYVVGSFLCLPLIEAWLNIDGFASVYQAFIVFSFITVLNQIPLAKLERNLEFKRVAWVELLGQLLIFGISLPLALRGSGAWAPTIGWCAQQVQSAILLWSVARLRPRLCWDWQQVREIVSYGFGVSASNWIWYLRTLINPMLVGRFAGETAVGQIAIAIRLLDMLGFAKTVTYRISIAALSQLQEDYSRLRRAISEGMELQILVLGPLLVLTSWIGPIMFPMIFGEEWAPAMAVFPFLAVACLSNGAFNLHCSALYVLRRNWDVTAFHVAYLLVFALLAAVLIPNVGLIGYGWAEAITVITYTIVHSALGRIIGHPDYSIAGLWGGAFSLALFSYQLGWWVTGVLVVVMVLPGTRNRIAHYVKSLRAMKAEPS